MNTAQFLASAWSVHPVLLLICSMCVAAYAVKFGWRGRMGYLFAAVAVLLLTLCSPLNALADGYLFSAHMAQHIMLLLVIPALLLACLPRDTPLKLRLNPVVSWFCGVGAMWLWHVPALCNAAAGSRAISTLQSITLVVMGTAFWWQVFAPYERDRLNPLAGVIYLFAACLGCTMLGIILTFAPVTVCAAYMHPIDRLGMLGTIRDNWGMSPERDQQVGGLMMWVPMCFIYLSAIFVQIARWYGAEGPVAVHGTPAGAGGNK